MNAPVLLITRNLPPLVGGMERLMLHTALGLAEREDLCVIGPRGCRAHLPDSVRCIEFSPSPALFLPLSLLTAIGLCWRRRPRLVLGGSGLLGPVLLLLGILCRVRTAIYLHGLDIVVSNRVYQALFVPSFRHMRSVLCNSENTKRLAKEAGVSSDRLHVVHPGTSLPALDKAQEAASFREQFELGQSDLLLFVGRVVPRKGLLGFVERALPAILQRRPELTLVVVGDHPGNSLAAQSSELQAVVASAERQGISSSILFAGLVDDSQLQGAYCAAGALIFPLVETRGDVEGFGMVAIEAAACGTPTVAFSVGGVTDAVEHGASGYLVAPGDYEGFVGAVDEALDAAQDWPQSCRQFASQFEWVCYHSALEQILGDDELGAGHTG